MPPEDHERLADRLEKESDRLAEESARLEAEIKNVRADWRAKQNDGAVPGAVQPPEERTAQDSEQDPPRETDAGA